MCHIIFGPFYFNLSQINLSHSSKFRGNESEHLKITFAVQLETPELIKVMSCNSKPLRQNAKLKVSK